MKKFQFNLDHVLGYKNQVLDSLQNEHAVLTQKLQRQEQALDQARQGYQDFNQEFRSAKASGLTVAEAIHYESGLRFWELEIERENKLLQQCRKETEEKRRQVVAARQDTASLEKLKDKKQEAYRKEAEKSEELLIEELVAAKRAMNVGIA